MQRSGLRQSNQQQSQHQLRSSAVAQPYFSGGSASSAAQPQQYMRASASSTSSFQYPQAEEYIPSQTGAAGPYSSAADLLRAQQPSPYLQQRQQQQPLPQQHMSEQYDQNASIDYQDSWQRQPQQQITASSSFVQQSPGPGGNKNKLLIELAEMRGNMEKLKKQLMQREETIRQFMQERAELQADRDSSLEQRERQRQLLQKLSEELKAIRDEKGQFDQRMDQTDKEQRQLYEYCQSLVETKAQLQLRVEEQADLLGRLQQENQELSKNHDTANRQVQELSQNCVDIQEQLERYRRGDLSLKQQFDQLKERFERKCSEYNELTAIQDELLSSINDAKNEASEARQLRDQRQDEFGRLQRDNEKQELLIASLRNEMRRQQQQFLQQYDSLTQTMETREHEHQGGIARLEKRIAELTESSDELQGRVDAQREELRNKEELIILLQDKTSDVASLLEQNHKKDQQIADLHDSLQKEQTHVKRQRHAHDDLCRDKEQLQRQLENLEEDRAEALGHSQDLQQQLEDTQKKLEETEKKLQEIKTEKTVERKMLYEEMHDVRQEKDNLQQDYDQAAQLVGDLEAKCTRLEHKLMEEQSRSEEESRRLHSMVADVQDRLRNVSRSTGDLSEELTKKTQQAHSLQKELEELRSTHKEMSAVKEELAKDYEASRVQLAGLQKEVERLRNDNTKLDTDRTVLQQAKEAEFYQHDRERKSFTTMVSALKSEISRKQQTVEQIRREQANKGTEASREREARIAAERETQRLQKDMDTLQDVINSQRTAARRNEEQIIKMRELMEKLEAEHERLEQERAIEKRVLGGEIQHLRTLNQKLEKQLQLAQKDADVSTQAKFKEMFGSSGLQRSVSSNTPNLTSSTALFGTRL